MKPVITMLSVEIGDVVTYATYYGSPRTVLVTGIGTESNQAVFDGQILDSDGQETGRHVWGYLDQIISVRSVS